MAVFVENILEKQIFVGRPETQYDVHDVLN